MLIFEKKALYAPLTLTLEREDVGGLTGQTPTIAIRNAVTSDSYLDFTGYTFKSSGWTEKYEAMTEVERGHYTYLLSLSAIAAIAVGDILSIEYAYDDGGVEPRVDQETALIVESITEIAADTANLITVVGGGLTLAQATQLKELWQILGLDPVNPLVVSTHSRDTDLISQTIQKNTPWAGHVTITRV